MVAERAPAPKSEPRTRRRPAAAASQTERTFPDILTPPEAAEYLRVSVRFVLSQARAGALPGHQLGREWRFSRRRLLRWVEEEPISEEFVDLALQAMAEERIAEAGEEDGLPWDEVERRLGL